MVDGTRSMDIEHGHASCRALVVETPVGHLVSQWRRDSAMPTTGTGYEIEIMK